MAIRLDKLSSAATPEESDAKIEAPQLPQSIKDGSLLYVHCMPHQSAEFSQLHGTPVRVVFKVNPVFSPALVNKYEKKFKRSFIPAEVLMVVKTTDTLSPFIIPREFLYENRPQSLEAIQRASKSLTERSGDVVKYVTGGAKQMAKSLVNQAIRDTNPRAIVLSPDDDRYNAALYFVRYHYNALAAGANRKADLQNEVCLLPDHTVNGMPVVWIIDKNIFLSVSKNPNSLDVALQITTPVEAVQAQVRRRLSFSKELPVAIKRLFSEDDLFLDGTVVNRNELPADVTLSEEEESLLRRGTAIATVIHIPGRNRYVCVERKFLTAIPR